MSPRARERIGVALGAIGLTALLAATTNHLDIVHYHWDFEHAIDMATRGLGQGHLVAPFAYRFLPTEIVRWLHLALGLDVHAGFALLAVVGVALDLALLYVFLRRLGAGVREAAAATLLTALQFYHARFLLFDVYRAETLAQPLLVLALLALFEGRVLLCLAASLVGLGAKEFLALPPLVLALGLAAPSYAPRPGARPRRLAALLVLLACAAAVVLPRLLLPVERSVQSIDFQHDPHALRWLSDYPKMHRRDINFVFCLLSFGLPVWVLATRARLAAALADLGPRRRAWAAYSVLVLVLTMWGGTDLARFVAYLFPPVADLLVGLIRRARGREIVYAVVATAVFNRLFVPVPMDSLAHYLDFYGGWDRTLTYNTLERALEVLAWTGGALALRRAWGKRNGAASEETAPRVQRLQSG